ncbi:MAG: carbon-nitrogen hydrolase family protein [Chloroflexi bacterium]|nr:MAG: carbon-nitrogen hydrolase family protein [Chloroflexota bacterium]
MREITVATVQMNPKLGQMEDNLIRMNELMTRAVTEQPVDLVVFPELVTTGYEVGPRFPELAQRIPGPTVNLIAQRASELGVHVAFGMVSKEKVESILYNTIVLIGPDGDLIGQYNKMHLRGEERIAFRPGYRLNSFETAFGTVGLMVGWDLAFPEVARSLVLEGAELLVVCANWENPHANEWRVYLLARACENAVFVAAANRVGEEPSYTFFGQSGIVGPQGKVYASIEANEGQAPAEGYAVARIDLDDVRQHREETQILQCRQPAAYRAIVKKY